MHELTLKISHWRVLLLLSAVCASASGQSRVAEITPGRFLVASRQLSDPNFAETVVLILHHDKSGTGGLIINRATGKPLSAVIDLDEAKRRKDRVYAGGPVERTSVRALIRSRTKPDDIRPVLEDVYVVTSRTLLQRALAANDAVRAYFGYCGWAAGQLDRELLAQAWHVMPGDPKLIFDPDPESVWQRLISRTELRLARSEVRQARYVSERWERDDRGDRSSQKVRTDIAVRIESAARAWPTSRARRPRS